jgi:menaquinone-dependent protoporphyrinogen oxidase
LYKFYSDVKNRSDRDLNSGLIFIYDKENIKMKTLIIYSSKYGFTKRISSLLKNKLKGETDIKNASDKEASKINFNNYDAVVAGSWVGAGKLDSKLLKILNKNLETLTSKKIGLFVTAGAPESKAVGYLKGFPSALYKKAVSKEVFGGEFKLGKLNFVERFIIVKIMGVKKDFTNIYEKNIDAFVKAISK